MMIWGSFQKLFGKALLVAVVLTAVGCGGGGSSSTGGGTTTPTSPSPGTSPSPTTPPPPATPTTIIVTADAGSVCETYVTGSTGTQALSCHHPKDPTDTTGQYYGNDDPNTAYLDGSKSTSSDGSTLTYAWTIVSRPSGSTVSLTGADTVNPTFVPDVAGAYVVQLVVSAIGVESQRSMTTVLARDGTTPRYPSHGGVNHDCTFCHNDNNSSLRTKSSTHIASSNVCVACHASSIMVGDYNIVAKVDHDEVFGVCSTCHDGVTATGKSSTHIQTSQECSDCHTTDNFFSLIGGAAFDHANATGPCSSCHNGVTATGTNADPNGHIAIGSTECNACHTTQSFKNPFVDHSTSAVVGNCSNCHSPAGANYAAGNTVPPATHPDTTGIECDVCHNVNGFKLNGVFDHQVLARHPLACKACHDGTNATGVPTDPAINHPVLTATQDCGACHTTYGFQPPFTVDHSGFNAATDCAGSGCHDGSSVEAATGINIPGKPSDAIHATVTDGFCGQCHTPGATFALATVDHQPYADAQSTSTPQDCTICHDGVVATGKPSDATHATVTDGFCGNCHDPLSDTFAGGTFDHSLIDLTATTCVSCHDGTTAKGQSPTHVPTSASMDCKVCHGSTNFSSFALPVFDHSLASITDNCTRCHDGLPHDGVVVIDRPSGHIPAATADCSVCHSDSTYTVDPATGKTTSSGFSTTPDKFQATVHPKYTAGCRSCHNGNYANAIYNASAHPPYTTDTTSPLWDSNNNVDFHAEADANGWDCNICHSVSGNFKDGSVNHKDPLVQSQPCTNCHVDGNDCSTAAKCPIGRPATHPDYANTATNCQNCHSPGGSFTAGFDHSLLDTSGYYNGTTCIDCHDGLNATGQPQNHVPTTRNCNICHLNHPPTATTFAGGVFDHTAPGSEALNRTCSSCHDVTPAILGALQKTDAPTTHTVTNADCGACHSTDAFKPATSFDHSSLTATDTCTGSSCHSVGNDAGAKTVNDVPNPSTLPHIPMNGADCKSCHTSPGGSFTSMVMDHTVVTPAIACETCHSGTKQGTNGLPVTPKGTNHFGTSIGSCKTCHTSTSDWTKVKYTHSGSNFPTGTNYPGDHNAKKVTSCTQCHTNNNDTITYQWPTYKPHCVACHYNQYKSGHGSTVTTSHQDCTGSGCHSVSGSSFNK